MRPRIRWTSIFPPGAITLVPTLITRRMARIGPAIQAPFQEPVWRGFSSHLRVRAGPGCEKHFMHRSIHGHRRRNRLGARSDDWQPISCLLVLRGVICNLEVAIL